MAVLEEQDRRAVHLVRQEKLAKEKEARRAVVWERLARKDQQRLEKLTQW